MRFIHKTNAIYAFIYLIAFLSFASVSQECHYSCANCTTPSYTGCFSCSDPSQILTVLQSPQLINPLYIHSIYDSGICTAKVPQGTNGLGVFLLIISIIGLVITQSHQLFYICSTFQTLALFGLLEVAWLEPASFILQAFQYFMPINLILAPSKVKDYELFIYNFYRLDQYMVSTQDIGLITIFIIDCILFLFIVALFALTLFRRKREAQRLELQKQGIDENGNNLVPQFSNTSQSDFEELKKHKKDILEPKKNKQNLVIESQNEVLGKGNDQPETCRQKLLRIICEKASQCLILRKIMHIIIYVFYFFIQETALSIMVGAVFGISSLDIVIWIVYFIEIVTVLVISIYETQVDKQLNSQAKSTHDFGLSLFLSRECLFVVLLKKIILPLGVVIPSNVQYIYFVLYLLLFLVEGSVDARSGRVACLSRITLWKIFQMCITTLILTFFFNERKGSSASNSNLITVILTITLVIFIIAFFVQLIISLVFMFLGLTQVHNAFEQTSIKHQKNLQLNNTQMTLNQIEKDNRNIFEIVQITRENTKTPKNIKQKYQKKKTVEVQEFCQEQNDEIKKPPVINNQLVISMSKESSKQKVQSDKNPQKQKKYEDTEKTSHKKDEKVKQAQKNQEEVQNENKDQKKTKRRRIQDPELRKRYGIK